MTLDEFLKKYNHCPFCRSYTIQGPLCDHCIYFFGSGYKKDGSIDKFDPTEDWIRLLNKEVTQ